MQFYVDFVKDLTDHILVVSDSLTKRDYILQAIRGLGFEYMSFITSIT